MKINLHTLFMEEPASMNRVYAIVDSYTFRFIFFIYLLPYFLGPTVWGQTYVMPKTGSASATTCGGTFLDSGGLSGNYSYNEEGVYTFCPGTPGQFIQITFTDFLIAPNYDYFFIYDGPSTSSKLLTGINGSAIPAPVKASISNTTGCLTVKFVSINLASLRGWEATISCVSTGGPITSFDNRDCYESSFICTDATFGGNNLAAGIQDLSPQWNPCSSSGERQSSWYYFRMATGGTLGLTIVPDPSVDYDFSIWGPYSSLRCPINTMDTPVRCSYASTAGNTGLGNGAFDFSEDGSGDKWVAEIPVLAGEFYVMNINNYTANSTPFNLNWNLSNGATFNCTVLPVGLVGFVGKSHKGHNELTWHTSSERNNDRFEIERSLDGMEFEKAGTVAGGMNSSALLSYNFFDPKIIQGENYYYRLRQIDLDGSSSFSNIILVSSNFLSETLQLYPNPANEYVQVKVNSKNVAYLEIEIFDVSGNKVISQKKQTESGENTYTINIEPLPAGVYYVKLKGAAEVHVAKFCKVKN